MSKSKYSKSSPGRLVATTAYEDRVRGGLTERVPVQGLAFIPDPLPPQLDWDVLIGRLRGPLLAAERGLARLDGKASLLPNPHLLLGPFWRREARLSSLIEDTVATPEEVVLAEAGRETDRDDPREVVNYIRALEHGLQSPLPLCNRLFKEMHHKLLSGVRGERDLPGEFRREQNYIGNKAMGFHRARFVPPPSGETLERCMADFEKFVNGSPAEVPPLIAVALAHYQFECIHPFRDGNGRLGRLIVVLSLCKTSMLQQPYVYMSGYFEAHRDEYRDLLLRVSTHGDWEAWLGFVLTGFAVQAADTDLRVNRLLSLRESFIKAVTDRRASALLLKFVESLFNRPAVTVEDTCRLLGVTTTAARKHIATLVEKRILEPWDVPGRAQWYYAREIVEATEADVSESGSSS